MRCVSCDHELTEDEVRYLDDICNQCETQRFGEFLEEMKNDAAAFDGAEGAGEGR